jgi:hypothetical protein
MFRHPFTEIISGPTGSGKTIHVRRVLEHWKELILFPINVNEIKVLWCYGQFQQLYNEHIKNVNVLYNDSLPSIDEISKSNFNIVILDDLMVNLAKDERLVKFFTVWSHHYNLSVIFVVQNLFFQSIQMRTISLNCHYIVVFKNRRDQSQIGFLGRQLFPHKWKLFIEAYEDATLKPFGYLIIDIKSDTPENLRLRTRVLPEELPPSLRGKVEFAPIIYEIK